MNVRVQLMEVRVRDVAGRVFVLAVEPGKRLMEVIRNSGIPVRAECGGVCACATCHVYVADKWRERLQPPDENETVLLEVADSVNETSRLSCQIKLTPELDGLEVTMAPGSE
jgi:2Fe-2S ferredoxin